MAVKKIEAFETSDNKIFLKECDAIDHENEQELISKYHDIELRCDDCGDEIMYGDFMDWLYDSIPFVERAIQFIKDTK